MSHTTPEEAVTIGIDVRAKTLVASHWGTVSSLEDEPNLTLRYVLKNQEVIGVSPIKICG